MVNGGKNHGAMWCAIGNDMGNGMRNGVRNEVKTRTQIQYSTGGR